MKAFVDIWAVAKGDDRDVDVRSVLTAVRAVPGVVSADWFFTSDDSIAIVDTDPASLEGALAAIDAIPDCTVSGVRLVRS